MSRGDYYYGSKYFRGLGKSFFLKVIQGADPGSSNRKLLGSVVDEIDYGFFGSREAPKPEHYFKPQLIIDKMLEHSVADTIDDLILSQDIASFEYELSVKRERGIDISANFPGLPVEAGIDIDYNSLRNVSIELGAGSTRYYIPKGYLEELYDKLDGDERKIKSRMDDDKMIVTSMIIARNFSSNISFKREIDFDLEARATALSETGSGLNFDKTSNRSMSVQFSGDKDYMIALGAIQWENLDR